MNDEYLWQKTGEDEELMRLESALASFRYRQTDPPEFAATLRAVTTKNPRWRAMLAIPAFAAALAVGVLWLQGGKSDDEVTFVHHPEVGQIELPRSEEPLAPAVTPEPLPVHRNRKNTRAEAVIDRRKSTAKPQGRKEAEPALTKEELYAYEQLMLALSISSSSLNIVRDTINGSEVNMPKPNNR